MATYPRIMPEITQQATIGDLKVDVVLERETTFDSEVTEYPVEGGFPIHDHVTRKPMKLSLLVVCTPTPVTGSPSQSRMNEVMNTIQSMYKAAEPVTVTLPDAIYRDMVMVHAPLPRTVRDGYCYRMQIDLVQIRKAKAKSEEIPEGNTSGEADSMSGTSEKDTGAASQKDIGTGLKTVDNTATVEINTAPQDRTTGGQLDTGKEQTANMVAQTLVACLVGRLWRV